EVLPPDSLSAKNRDDMYALLCGQFEGVTRAHFEADLAEKNRVVLLRSDAGAALRGFSTLHVSRRSAGGEELGVVYSGDTVVDARGGMGSSLSRIWIGAVNSVAREMGLDRLVWLLLTSGYRTYRFLPMYWLDFHPRYDVLAPEGIRDLMSELARQRFGDRFDEFAGVVRFEHPQVLKKELRGIPLHRIADPHVAFFATANPGHEAGDELVCLTELAESNLTPAGVRMWKAGERLFGQVPQGG
ncbi:MAG TPA: hypothetical protein VLA09_01580, partial [Longimicrobiales bacterium]|nr:hypothetical protein [Longimicrobiales bacterium]